MMRKYLRTYDKAIEWTLGLIAVLVPVAAWLGKGDVREFTLYEIFPPLGLMAFGLMWTHFVMGAIRRYSGSDRKSNAAYMNVSTGLVLALILLHPGLFYFALYLDGYGLPPQSYMEAYAMQIGLITLGTIGLLIFLSYELKRFFGDKPWWKVIELLQIIGMAAIFIHGLGIGSDISSGWIRSIWIIYGISLLIAVIYSRVIYKEKGALNANK